MKETEIAGYLEYRNFPEELRLYIERLCNGRDYSQWKQLAESGEAIVKVSMAANNRLTIKAYETQDELVKELEAKVDSQEQTIKEQTKEIKSLKKEAEQKATEEVITTDIAKPKGRRKKTENP